MYCTRCGREIQPGASFCWNCGAAITAAPSAGSTVPSTEPPVLPAVVPGGSGAPSWPPAGAGIPPAPPAAVTASPATSPALALAETWAGGFWRRVWATCIDTILLNILNLPFTLLWMPAQFRDVSPGDINPEDFALVIGAYVATASFGFVLSWLYFAILESSPAQATLGKMALGVKVCDSRYQRLRFGRATGRYFAKILSSLTLGIGYLMAAFTARKRALHDMLAGTLVIRG